MSYADFEPGGGSPVECYRFVQGASEWLFTSGDESVTTDAGGFSPAVINRGSISANQEARTQSVDVIVEAENPVAMLFANTPDTPVFLTIYRTHRDDPDEEVVVVFAGQVKNCTFTPHVGTLHCVPMQDVVERDLAQLTYQTTCNNKLFDNRCQVERGDFTYSHEITNIEPVQSNVGAATAYTLDSAAAAFFVSGFDGILKDGVAQFGTQKVAIIYHSGDVIWTLVPLRDAVIGDTIDVTAGCPKTIQACRDLFDNIERFQGFPHIPQRNPFGSGGLQ